MTRLKNNFASICIILLGPFCWTWTAAAAAGTSEHAADQVSPNLSEYPFALTPAQWLARYTCNWTRPEPSQRTLGQVLFGDECEREPTAWKWKYVDEYLPPYKVTVRDDLVDQRLSNIIYTVDLFRPSEINIIRFNADPTAEQDMDQIAGEQVDDERCARQLAEMLAQLDEMGAILERKRNNQTSAHLEERHLSLARVLDAFGRYDSGYLSGGSHSFGAYDQCLSSRLLLSGVKNEGLATANQSLVATRYCWAQLNMGKHLDESLRRRKLVYYEFAEKYLNVAVCLPVACHSKSFAKHRELFQRLVGSQFRMPKSMYLNESPAMEALFCAPDEDSAYMRWSAGTKLFVISLIGWLLLTLGVTYWNHGSRTARNSRALEWLDLSRAWREFACLDEPPSERSHVDLDALNLVKVLATASMVLAHSYLLSAAYASQHLQTMADTERIARTSVLIGLLLIVDTFLVLSGLLITYSSLGRLTKYLETSKESSRQKGASSAAKLFSETKWLAAVWLKLVSVRYLRLVPLLFVLFWFRKTLFMHLGAGPLWDYGLNQWTQTGACLRETWWTPFTYQSAYLPMTRQCITTNWYVGVDLFINLWFVPPVVYLMARKRPAAACALAAAFSLLGHLVHLRDLLAADPSQFFELRELRYHGWMRECSSNSLAYTKPIYRISRTMIGVLAGYALRSFEAASRERPAKAHRWPRWFRGPATWLAFAVVMFMPFHNTHLAEMRRHLYPYYRAAPILLNPVYSVLWSLANVVLFVRLASDWKDSLAGCFSKAPLFRSLTKLSFAALYVHWMLITYDFSLMTKPLDFSLWLYYKTFFAAYLITMLISLACHVLIECPIGRLLRELIR